MYVTGPRANTVRPYKGWGQPPQAVHEKNRQAAGCRPYKALPKIHIGLKAGLLSFYYTKAKSTRPIETSAAKTFIRTASPRRIDFPLSLSVKEINPSPRAGNRPGEPSPRRCWQAAHMTRARCSRTRFCLSLITATSNRHKTEHRQIAQNRNAVMRFLYLTVNDTIMKIAIALCIITAFFRFDPAAGFSPASKGLRLN